ncbi:uncharacterized protein N7483_000147 [Penicillium malachiteum]|uniref:uncharacterized protein n=1 Tax=Penicillium malachiteum TaxID=1324776 RepID=UPI002549223E|nr:uncharacterized protein N7483_000147 [Penicillium malachiteum]KAJ5735022.1 hypothetical protein N7483_000147 [Penicillium malachiteum]
MQEVNAQAFIRALYGREKKQLNECYFTFPIWQFAHYSILFRWEVSHFILGNFGSGAYDCCARPGKKYVHMIDKEDYLKKLILILECAWPIAQGNTVSNDLLHISGPSHFFCPGENPSLSTGHDEFAHQVQDCNQKPPS